MKFYLEVNCPSPDGSGILLGLTLYNQFNRFSDPKDIAYSRKELLKKLPIIVLSKRCFENLHRTNQIFFFEHISNAHLIEPNARS